MWIIFVIYVSFFHAFLSVHCSLVVTYWERPYLLVFLCVMFYCVLSLSRVVPVSGVVLDYIDS